MTDQPDDVGSYGSGWPTSGQERGIGQFMARLGTNHPNPRLRTMLRDLYGSSTRDRTQPDTARAATELGVSRRTVQRWLQQGRLPAKDRSGIAARVRAQWADSPAGRARRIPSEIRRVLKSGQPVGGRVKAAVAVSNDARNGLERAFAYNLTGHEAGALYNALLAGNDEAAYDIFHQAVSRGFGGSVDLSIRDLTLGIPR